MEQSGWHVDMSCSLNSLEEIIEGSTLGVTNGETQSLDYGSYDSFSVLVLLEAGWVSPA